MSLSIPIMNPVRFRDNSKRPDYDNTFPLPDTQQIGQLMEEGVYPGAYVQDWISDKSIVLQLRTTTTAPDLIAVRANQSNLLTGLANGGSTPYDTFTSSGVKITSAISDGTGEAECGSSNSFLVYDGEIITVMFDLDLNSGIAPDVKLTNGLGGTAISNVEQSADGVNTIALTSTKSQLAWLTIANDNGHASNFATSNITILRSYRTVAGVDITPSGWTGDDVYKYTFTPDFSGLFYMFLEDTNYITDYIYAWPDSAIYRSNFISGVDTWVVDTDSGTNTVISNFNEKLSINVVDVGGGPDTSPIIEFTVDSSFEYRDWVMTIKADGGVLTAVKGESGFDYFAITFDGEEYKVYANGIGSGNVIQLIFNANTAPYICLIDYVTVEARNQDMVDKRRLVEVDFQNTENDYGMVFWDGVTEKYEGKILLTGRMLDPQPANDRSVFESDRAALETLRSTPKKIYALKINDVTRAMADQINHIFACDTLTINGEVYQIPETLEVEPIEGSDLININVNIQQAENDYFI